MKTEIKTKILSGLIFCSLDPGLSDSSFACKPRQIKTQVDAAALLDEALHESTSCRGSWGAAGAHAMLIFEDYENENFDLENFDGEDFNGMDHPEIQKLPIGTAKAARCELKLCRGVEAWNGNNFIPHPTENVDEILLLIRENEKQIKPFNLTVL